jgi:hypothetical protein
MRVYTPEEVVDFLHAGNRLPSPREPTAVWQDFLARMRPAPQTPRPRLQSGWPSVNFCGAPMDRPDPTIS